MRACRAAGIRRDARAARTNGWPIRSEARLYDRLSTMPVRIAHVGTAEPEAWRRDGPTRPSQEAPPRGAPGEGLVVRAGEHASIGLSRRKKLIVFDLDGTLAESKTSLDAEMALLLGALLGVVKVAVISGGGWPQFQRQLLSRLSEDRGLGDLSLLPTCGTQFYQHTSGWTQLYAENFSDEEKQLIVRALKQAIDSSGFPIEATWGEQIEDRGSQITFSALGQQAPIEEKQRWDPDFSKRKRMQACLEQLIPEFSVRLGGTTSVDVTKLGIDKGYGISKLRDTLGVGLEEMLFIGDALFPGGNDHPVKEAGVESIQVRDPDETKRVIEAILACVGGVGRTRIGESDAR